MFYMIILLEPRYFLYLENNDTPRFHEFKDVPEDVIAGEIMDNLEYPVSLPQEYHILEVVAVSFMGQKTQSEAEYSLVTVGGWNLIQQKLPAPLIAVETNCRTEAARKICDVGVYECWAGIVDIQGYVFTPLDLLNFKCES